MFSYDVKFLTNEDAVYVKSGDFKCSKYETKKKNDESTYDTSKKNFLERRGSYCTPTRTRQLRQLETKLRDKTIIACKWFSDNYVTLVFSSGVIAHITVKCNCLDVPQILFDKYCVGKLVGQTMTAVTINKSAVLFIAAERTATLITFGKVLEYNKPYLLSEREPTIQLIELGGSARRVERHVSSFESSSGVSVLVWGSTTTEPAPWSPVSEDHNNLHLYHIVGQKLSLIAHHQLENEVLLAELSDKCESVVHVVEQLSCHKNGVTLVWSRYEVPHNSRSVRLSTLTDSTSHTSLPAPARAAQRSPCDRRLLAACIDGSVHVLHHSVGITHSTRAAFIATDVRWAGDVVVAAEEGGRLQCFDRALSALHQHTKFIDLTTYLRDSRRIQILGTHRTRSGPVVLATFSGGPLALLKITHPRIITAWIRAGRLSHAVSLLRALDWDDNSAECVRSVDEVLGGAMRAGGAGGERLAVAALGVYLAPPAPLPRSAHAHARALHDRARTFFHYLLRRGRIEKALSLAVELSAWDLFADARWAAQRRGLDALAQEAAELARVYASGSECSDSCSQCSSQSYTGSEDESSTSSRAVKTRPPPLPRVPVPPQPPILTVPILPNETLSTNSIRPNLHQYLERDNTIWAKDANDTKIWANQPEDNLIWSKDTKITSIWPKDTKASTTWTNAGDNLIWPKDIKNTAMWTKDPKDTSVNRAKEINAAPIRPRDVKENSMWINDPKASPIWSIDANSASMWPKNTNGFSIWENEVNHGTVWAKDTKDITKWHTDTIRPKDPKTIAAGSVDTWVYGRGTKDVRDDSYMYTLNHTKQLQNQNLRWSSMDNVLSLKQRNPSVDAINVNLESQRDDGNGSSRYKHIFQTELKEELPRERLMQPNANFNGRYRLDSTCWPSVRPEREKNKVKFSETVTVAVVPESPTSGADVARELADSLPLCAPHKYLAAFAPAHAPAQATPPGSPPPRPPKIKVVHFGMV